MNKILSKLEKLCISLGGGAKDARVFVDKASADAAKAADAKNAKKGIHLGNAAIVAAVISTAKGVFRPLFTMADKKEEYETKKYTALREGLTEGIAIPIYILSGIVTGKISDKIAKTPKYFNKMARQKLDIKNRKNLTPEGNKLIKETAEELAERLSPKIRVNLGFIGVGLSALLIIPALCSAIIKPIMNSIQKPQQEGMPQAVPSPATVQHINKVNTISNMHTVKKLNTFANTTTNVGGMKVGGV